MQTTRIVKAPVSMGKPPDLASVAASQPAAGHAARSILLEQNERLEAPNEMAENFSKQHQQLQALLAGKSDQEVASYLTKSRGQPSLTEVASSGFLYAVLTVDSLEEAQKSLYRLSISIADEWYATLCNVNMIILELFYHLKPMSRERLMFFLNEAIRLRVPKIDNVLSNFLRATSEGIEPKETNQVTLSLAEILLANKPWMQSLKANVSFFPVLFMHCTRCLADYHQLGGGNERYKTALTALCTFTLEERFGDLLILGRDLLLGMMRVAKLTAFQPIWRAMMHNPGSLLKSSGGPGVAVEVRRFTGIAQLLTTPCTPNLLQFRVSLQLQRKIDFMLKSKQPIGATKHLEWIAKSNLAHYPSMRSDCLRYLWHLASIGPQSGSPSVDDARTQLATWLLMNARPGADLQWCKMSLLLDYLGQTTMAAGQVWTVEPAFSVLVFLMNGVQPAMWQVLSQYNGAHYSTLYSKNFRQMANSLVDFLMKAAMTLHPPLAEQLNGSVGTAFRMLQAAGFPVHNVLDGRRLDPSLRQALYQQIPNLPASKTPSTPMLNIDSTLSVASVGGVSAGSTNTKEIIIDEPGADAVIDWSAISASSSSSNNNVNSTKPGHSTSAAASTSTAKSPEKQKKKKPQMRRSKNHRLQLKSALTSPPTYSSFTPTRPLSSSFGSQAQSSKSREEHLEAGRQLLALKAKLREGAGEAAIRVVNEKLRAIMQGAREENCCAGPITSPAFYQPIFEALIHSGIGGGVDDEDADIIELSEDDSDLLAPIHHLLTLTLHHDSGLGASAGYLLLHHLASSPQSDHRASVYRDWCASEHMEMEEDEDIWSQLIDDLEECSLHDHRIFTRLISYVHRNFWDELTPSSARGEAGNTIFVALIRLICSTIDASELRHLVGEVIRDELTFFEEKIATAEVLKKSLTWSTMEQHFLWELIRAHSLEIDWFIPLISHLRHERHGEATTSLLLMLRETNHQPTLSLMKHLFNRPCVDGDQFVMDMMRVLTNDEEYLIPMAKCLGTLLKKALQLSQDQPQPSSSSRPSSTPSVEQIIAHLHEFLPKSLSSDVHRQHMSIYESKYLQEPLQTIRSERRFSALRNKFHQLFTAVDEIRTSTMGVIADNGRGSPRKAKLRAEEGMSIAKALEQGSVAGSKRRRVMDSLDD